MDLQIASHVVMRVYITWGGCVGPPRPTLVCHRTPMNFLRITAPPWNCLRMPQDASGCLRMPQNYRRKREKEECMIMDIWDVPKILRTTQDHLRTTSEPQRNQTPYNIHRKLLHICHTLGDIQKKMGYPKNFCRHT